MHLTLPETTGPDDPVPHAASQIVAVLRSCLSRDGGNCETLLPLLSSLASDISTANDAAELLALLSLLVKNLPSLLSVVAQNEDRLLNSFRDVCVELVNFANGSSSSRQILSTGSQTYINAIYTSIFRAAFALYLGHYGVKGSVMLTQTLKNLSIQILEPWVNFWSTSDKPPNKNVVIVQFALQTVLMMLVDHPTDEFLLSVVEECLEALRGICRVRVDYPSDSLSSEWSVSWIDNTSLSALCAVILDLIDKNRLVPNCDDQQCTVANYVFEFLYSSCCVELEKLLSQAPFHRAAPSERSNWDSVGECKVVDMNVDTFVDVHEQCVSSRCTSFTIKASPQSGQLEPASSESLCRTNMCLLWNHMFEFPELASVMTGTTTGPLPNHPGFVLKSFFDEVQLTTSFNSNLTVVTETQKIEMLRFSLLLRTLIPPSLLERSVQPAPEYLLKACAIRIVYVIDFLERLMGWMGVQDMSSDYDSLLNGLMLWIGCICCRVWRVQQLFSVSEIIQEDSRESVMKVLKEILDCFVSPEGSASQRSDGLALTTPLEGGALSGCRVLSLQFSDVSLLCLGALWNIKRMTNTWFRQVDGIIYADIQEVVNTFKDAQNEIFLDRKDFSKCLVSFIVDILPVASTSIMSVLGWWISSDDPLNRKVALAVLGHFLLNKDSKIMKQRSFIYLLRAALSSDDERSNDVCTFIDTKLMPPLSTNDGPESSPGDSAMEFPANSNDTNEDAIKHLSRICHQDHPSISFEQFDDSEYLCCTSPRLLSDLLPEVLCRMLEIVTEAEGGEEPSRSLATTIAHIVLESLTNGPRSALPGLLRVVSCLGYRSPSLTLCLLKCVQILSQLEGLSPDHHLVAMRDPFMHSLQITTMSAPWRTWDTIAEFIQLLKQPNRELLRVLAAGFGSSACKFYSLHPSTVEKFVTSIFNACREMSETKSVLSPDNTSIVFHVLPFLSPPGAASIVPAIVAIADSNTQKLFFRSLCLSDYHTPPFASPRALLLFLADNEDSSLAPEELKSLMTTLDYCIDDAARFSASGGSLQSPVDAPLFSPEMFRNVLMDIVDSDKEKLPKLFGRLVIQCLNKIQPEMGPFIAQQLLPRLATRKVWLDQIAWLGVKAALQQLWTFEPHRVSLFLCSLPERLFMTCVSELQSTFPNFRQVLTLAVTEVRKERPVPPFVLRLLGMSKRT